MTQKVSFVDSESFSSDDKNQSATLISKKSTKKNILERFLIENDDKKSLLLWIEHYHLDGDIPLTKEILESSIFKFINEIDNSIELMVNNILHHSEFQTLEASWRSLDYLIDHQEQYDKSQTVKIKVLNCSWRTLSKDLNKGVDFDQTQFFHLVHNEEFDRSGGEPFGLIIGDYRISHLNRKGSHINDIDTLKEISLVCAASFSPFIVSAEASLFGVDTISSLGAHVNLSDHFNQSEYRKWLSLRDMVESRFIGIVVPDILMRAPYTNDGHRSESFRFRERVKNVESDYLWGNAAFAFGGVILRSFAEFGWFEYIRGMTPGELGKGLVNDLPVMPKETNKHEKRGNKPSVNLQISMRGEVELSENGFIPLSAMSGCEHLVFYSNSSIQRVIATSSVSENESSSLSAMLQYVFCVSRFGHYVKVIGREKIGTYDNASQCEDDLHHWIVQYTSISESMSDEVRCKFPLKSAQVKVIEVPGKQGHYYMKVDVQPHFQLEQLGSKLQLVTELSANK